VSERRHIFCAVVGVVAGLFSIAAQAEVTVKDAWVRGTLPAQTVTGAFMEIVSSEDATVISASSPLSEVVEIHSMTLENGVMKMRPLSRLALSAGTPVKLAPGGYHLMLMGLKKTITKGDVVPITLKVKGTNKKTKRVEVRLEVRDLTEVTEVTAH